jgi:hypothetical protein
MPALVESPHRGTIVWLGRVARPVGDDLIIHGEPLAEMPLTFAGYAGEIHAGETRPACTRVRDLHPRNTPIRNVRQLSIVSEEEMAAVAGVLGLAAMDYAWLGASVVVSGIPDFTHLPPSSRLQAEDGCTLVVDMENLPCQEPARTIEAACPGHGRAFRTAARDRRGVTAWVEREGVLRRGGALRLFVPAQRSWRPDAATA